MRSSRYSVKAIGAHSRNATCGAEDARLSTNFSDSPPPTSELWFSFCEAGCSAASAGATCCHRARRRRCGVAEELWQASENQKCDLFRTYGEIANSVGTRCENTIFQQILHTTSQSCCFGRCPTFREVGLVRGASSFCRRAD